MAPNMYCLVFVLVLKVLKAEYCSLGPFNHTFHITGGGKNDLDKLHELERALEIGQGLAKLQYEFNEWLPIHGVHMTRNSTGFFRFNTGKQPPALVRRYQTSQVILKGLQVYLTNNLNRFSNETAKNIMRNLYESKFRILGICDNMLNKYCTKKSRKYRTINGTCNNLKHPYWGAAQSSFTRLLNPEYEDGISRPRMSITGEELPSPREISFKVFKSDVTPDLKLTLMASEMAQLIAHDTQQALPDTADGVPIKCCTDSGNHLPLPLRHTSCMPISIPKNDPVFGKYRQRCMNFIRSVTVPRSDCTIGPAEQVNMVTSFLDCSFVYGSREELNNELRTFEDGKLKESSKKNRMLPLTNIAFCDYRNTNEACYIAGDSRVNQNPHLVAMQVIFLREHNRIASELKKLNPHWYDELLFQETRRILIAIYQHIVYREYLPLFLGKKFEKKLFDGSDEHGFTQNYRETINPGSINSMNIVFRCYHSTLPDKINLCNESGQVKSEHRFSDYFVRPIFCCNNHDEILNGLCCSPMMKMGDCVTSEITDKLFKSTSEYGLDLVSFDIQRERDHGIPSYNKFREFYGLGKVTSFAELIPDMGEERVRRLQNVYKHVEDIDLIVGSQLEHHTEGTQFGPVTLSILREQFYRYMCGDRFFYTNKNQAYPFTKEQLEQIQKASIARLICDNGNDIKSIQRNVFQRESKRNPRVRCSLIPQVDLRPWKEEITRKPFYEIFVWE